ncbi:MULTISPECIES: MBL fold metallo-hydrolase [Yoonia]|jgi:glyoxylase-like metal-dependent hydrolase (beta-lactamase superfamily II)|uniref:Metallo-beta-lactamase family protein n=1 Tax=Yoonia vestfoldensis SKA53 TaxID=314232 RepID=A3V3W3_9RHOB|nr:MBL fold metallo-hydrolase [Yoonia vestfoldensis]EAQ07170.1 metallo-beta-lactamase family protein [Yoonia vestfoldensis SKA53]
MKPEVKAFFDEATNTISYVVREPQGNTCAIVDSVLDYDPAAGRTDTTSADAIIAWVKDQGLNVAWILESHVHADHLSAAPYLQEHLGGKIGIGSNITVVQNTFGKIFNEGTAFQRDGSQFDALFNEADTFHIGQLRADVLHTPGHTPACLTYVIGDAAFVGDTLFMPDFGTARCDFPGGSAEDLYNSIQKILALPDDTRIFVGHDYKAPGRDEFAWETTVGEQKAMNIHIGAGKPLEDFVSMRTTRDAQLGMPRLILPSLQTNMRAGNLPEPEDNGARYFKVPINQL